MGVKGVELGVIIIGHDADINHLVPDPIIGFEMGYLLLQSVVVRVGAHVALAVHHTQFNEMHSPQSESALQPSVKATKATLVLMLSMTNEARTYVWHKSTCSWKVRNRFQFCTNTTTDHIQRHHRILHPCLCDHYRTSPRNCL